MKADKGIVRFGTVLRQLREGKGMSQQELADFSGVHQKTIQRIESATLNPSLKTILSLAEGLEISPAKFFED